MTSEQPSEEELARQVTGEYNTFRVYIYMLKTERSSSGDVQRALGFSSPTLAVHHLDKLSKLGLVHKQYDGSYIVQSKSFGVLKLYVRTGRWILPRTMFFIAIFATMATGFFFLAITQREPFFYWIALVISTAGLSFSIFETYSFYRVLPPA